MEQHLRRKRPHQPGGCRWPGRALIRRSAASSPLPRTHLQGIISRARMRKSRSNSRGWSPRSVPPATAHRSERKPR